MKISARLSVCSTGDVNARIRTKQTNSKITITAGISNNIWFIRAPNKQEMAGEISGSSGMDPLDQVVILRIRHLPERGPPAGRPAARISGVVYQREEDASRHPWRARCQRG